MGECEKADAYLESVTADVGSRLRSLMAESYYLAWKDDFQTFLHFILKNNKDANEKEQPSIAERSSVVGECTEEQADNLLRLCQKYNFLTLKKYQQGKKLIAALKSVSSESMEKKRLSGRIRRIPKEVWEDWERESFQNPSEEEKRRICGALDLSACFKINAITLNVDNNLYELTFPRLFPRLMNSVSDRARWQSINDSALAIRNEMVGHANDGNEVAAWRNESRYWEEIAFRLRRPETEQLYAAFCHSLEDGNRQLNLVAVPWQDIIDGSRQSLNACREILCGVYHFKEDGTYLYCDGLDEALNAIYNHISFQAFLKQNQSEIAKTDELQKAHPDLSRAEITEMVKEEETRKKVQSLPDLRVLADYKGGFLNMQQLRELCTTHFALLDSSLLMSEFAQNFILGDLAQAAGRRADGKPPFVVEASNRMEIFKQRQEGEHRHYYFMHDCLCGQMRLVRYVGAADPFASKDDMLFDFLEKNKQRRICIFTSGNPSFVKKAKHEDYPLCVIVDVSKN